MAKWIIGIIVVGLLGAAVWYSGVLTPKATETTTTATSTAQTQTQPQPENGMTANNDVSDEALVTDSAAIDAQIKGLSDDSAAVDASTNDKAVTQTY